MARGLALVALVLVAAVLTGPRAHAGVADSRSAAGPRAGTSLEGSLLERINRARQADGLRALRISQGLRRAASAHARWLTKSGSFTHSSADGSSPTARIRRYYRGALVGETLLWGSPSVDADDALRRWLESPSHRGVLLDRRFREIGLSAVSADDAPGTFRGLDVTVFGRTAAPYLNSDLIHELGARYLSTVTTPIADGARLHGPFDLIFEATGASSVVFESMQALAKNGVLVLSSVTGGDRMIQVPADRINLEFVLGNKVMVGTVNANREYFESGVKDMAHAEAQYPGWLGRLLTHPVRGLENWRQLLDTLTNPGGAIKVYCEVATPPRS